VVTLDIIWPHITAIIGSLILLFVFVVVASVFLRRSLIIVSEKTGVRLFGTTGLLILIGAVLTIIGIGFILLWIALILLNYCILFDQDINRSIALDDKWQVSNVRKFPA